MSTRAHVDYLGTNGIAVTVERGGWRYRYEYTGRTTVLKAESPEGVKTEYTEWLYGAEYIRTVFAALTGGTVEQWEVWCDRATTRSNTYQGGY